jgi:hypothetical protein
MPLEQAALGHAQADPGVGDPAEEVILEALADRVLVGHRGQAHRQLLDAGQVGRGLGVVFVGHGVVWVSQASAAPVMARPFLPAPWGAISWRAADLAGGLS